MLHSDSETGWDSSLSVNEIIATLDPLAVSVLSGSPLCLGWKQNLLTPDCFLLKYTQSTDIFTRPFNTVIVETIAGSPFYTIFPAPELSMIGTPGLDGFNDLH